MATTPHPILQNPRASTTSPQYLIRLSQSHTSFRIPELEALASDFDLEITFHFSVEDSPYCILTFTHNQPRAPSQWHQLAATFMSRSILSKSIHELYATAPTYDLLHQATKALPLSVWTEHRDTSFKFVLDIYAGTRSMAVQRELIESFSYLPLEGRIRMKDPDQRFVVCEEWELMTPEEQSLANQQVHAGSQSEAQPQCDVAQNSDSVDHEISASTADPANDTGLVGVPVSSRQPKRLYFARFLASSRRELCDKHDLKKRPYISTTSMDAELALVTANIALAGPGKLFLDPFTGTGGFMVAAAELGALTLGSDIDGRSFRGKSRTAALEKGVGANFKKYGLGDCWGDCITADLTNTPLRVPGKSASLGCSQRWLDGIICDPPYGIREGLKVLGRRPTEANTTNGRAVHDGPYFVDGVPSHTLPDFIAPKRPYSFNRMLGDILDFAARTLVDGGRLAFWMPVANGEDTAEEFPIPMHPMLDLKASCIQIFNKWSRRLLLYQRLPGDGDLLNGLETLAVDDTEGRRADELNQFRRMYFQGFQTPSTKEGKAGSRKSGCG